MGTHFRVVECTASAFCSHVYLHPAVCYLMYARPKLCFHYEPSGKKLWHHVWLTSLISFSIFSCSTSPSDYFFFVIVLTVLLELSPVIRLILLEWIAWARRKMLQVLSVIECLIMRLCFCSVRAYNFCRALEPVPWLWNAPFPWYVL